ncbi:MAG: cytochrome c3 family protein [Candidatus Omnitrophica bacterium]|nr:cytochrome c3 family protein [Candidatus Omnitrophota bacterium]
MRPHRIPPQILRLILLTLAIVGVYSVARYFLTPASFGRYGWYRAAALGEIAAYPPDYAGKAACAQCHKDKAEQIAKGPHKALSCESCHGPGMAHVGNPDVKLVKPAAPLCLRCHEANPSRPEWLKQVTLADHYGENCLECHVPHQPNEAP